VSNYKNIDIDITYKSQKIVERSEFVYFSDITDLDPTLKANLTILNFTLMTPIQREVIKFIRNGSDVMGCSQTGTGKTIAFLLPIISRMLNEMPSPLTCNPPSPRLLILIPTRELAEQIFTEARKIVNKTGIVVNKIYGGVPHDEQLEKMYSGCDILVATPGRLLDFIEKKNLSLKNVKYLIMDEADRMLDMGFQPQLMKIAFGCDLMPKNLRQNLLFSATFTEEIKNISKNFMNEDHYFIQTIFDKNPSKNIKQELYYATETDKIDKLHEILKNTSGSIISEFLIYQFIYSFPL
jgi:ATP-dependent RNA helicase DDX3X